VHRKVRTRAYRAAENIRHSLRNGFTAYNVLSLRIAPACEFGLSLVHAEVCFAFGER
jgi:hypothetical protein